jgi:predicted thioesterase
LVILLRFIIYLAFTCLILIYIVLLYLIIAHKFEIDNRKGIIMSEKILSKTLRVEEENLAVAMGSGSLAVLATPAVVALMENAAAELANVELNNEELTTVGTMISIEHTSPDPLGAEVTAVAKLVETDGRTFKFEVSAFDKKGEIAKGTHTRVSVKAEKFQMKADGKFDEV